VRVGDWCSQELKKVLTTKADNRWSPALRCATYGIHDCRNAQACTQTQQVAVYTQHDPESKLRATQSLSTDNQKVVGGQNSTSQL